MLEKDGTPLVSGQIGQIGMGGQVSVKFDEEYMSIGGHVDVSLQKKIINFDYVDFSRLIPRDKVTKFEDNRFELVMKGGSTFFAPVADRDVSSISNFSRWEQAFRIYSNILTGYILPRPQN